jgi:hypothetical protein
VEIIAVYRLDVYGFYVTSPAIGMSDPLDPSATPGSSYRKEGIFLRVTFLHLGTSKIEQFKFITCNYVLQKNTPFIRPRRGCFCKSCFCICMLSKIEQVKYIQFLKAMHYYKIIIKSNWIFF